MTTTTLSVLFGVGGFKAELPHNNILEQTFLVEADGTWTRQVRDGAGTVLSSTPAEAPAAPVAEPEPVDTSADLRFQVAALTASNAAMAARLETVIAALGGL